MKTPDPSTPAPATPPPLPRQRKNGKRIVVILGLLFAAWVAYFASLAFNAIGLPREVKKLGGMDAVRLACASIKADFTKSGSMLLATNIPPENLLSQFNPARVYWFSQTNSFHHGETADIYVVFTIFEEKALSSAYVSNTYAGFVLADPPSSGIDYSVFRGALPMLAENNKKERGPRFFNSRSKTVLPRLPPSTP